MMESEKKHKTEKATFGAGCFWGIEVTFRNVEGVLDTTVGYMGGHQPDPTYQDVCTGRTGHAEVVQVVYDPAKLNYDQLLQVFWRAHDPTQLNRQGTDVGSQYRSVIFFHSDEQRVMAETTKENWQQSPEFSRREIVTKISPADTFYPAEEYHQQYLVKRGMATCRV
ncbi:peptide-methionine (S)-S-oxide reductase MsrA [Pontibacter akesuensis]|nr:peptide-methionine (S)-S-oxide reductase MsrA [Pontibacter akesuensis]GHA67042.1 peptide-methionine (S)-S-oxide reductase [Pontibacter akesuensis]